MNVLKALITAIKMQLVTTLKEVSPALVTMDTQAMGPFAWVSIVGNEIIISWVPHNFFRLIFLSTCTVFITTLNICI